MMLDIVLTAALMLLVALLNRFLNLNNFALQNLVELIPLFLLALRLWYNRPRNYLYMQGMINRNIKYEMMIKVEECDIDKDFYDQLCKKIRQMYGTKTGREVKKSEGPYLWSAYLEVDATLIELTYKLEEGNLFIEAKAKTKFRHFVRDVERVIDCLAEVFARSECKCNKQLIGIKITYMNRKREDMQNPFLSKFFAKFEKIIIKLQYNAKYGSRFVIDNSGVNVTGTNLNSIKQDLKKEMLLF